MNVVTLRLVTLYIDLLDVGKSAHFMNIKIVKSVAGLLLLLLNNKIMSGISLRFSVEVPADERSYSTVSNTVH